MSIRILIADDHKIMRQGLRSLIEKQGDMQVVGEAENGNMALRIAQETSPNIIIMDITMPCLNGIEATQQIVKNMPNTKVIALSVHPDRRFIIGMLSAGASGYLLKDCAFEEVVNAIRTVYANRTYLHPTIIDQVIQDYVNHVQQKGNSVYNILTSREREVLQNLAEGKSAKNIAVSLCLSVKTVEVHRQQIMKKLGISNIADLTKYAIQEGIISL